MKKSLSVYALALLLSAPVSAEEPRLSPPSSFMAGTEYLVQFKDDKGVCQKRGVAIVVLGKTESGNWLEIQAVNAKDKMSEWFTADQFCHSELLNRAKPVEPVK